MSDNVTELPVTPISSGAVSSDDHVMVSVSITGADGRTYSSNVYGPEAGDQDAVMMARMLMEAVVGAASARGGRMRAAVLSALSAYSVDS